VYLCAVNVLSIVRDRLLCYVSPSELYSTSQVSHENYRQTVTWYSVKTIDARINGQKFLLELLRILVTAIKTFLDYLSQI